MAEKKILVVDYDPASLEKTAKLLKVHKYRVVKACDGQAGYDSFKAEEPDLVVIEAMLPKMHGFDLCQKISRESQGQAPIVLISGLYKGPQYRQEALSAMGASEYFEKPLDAEAFIGAVKRLLRDDDDFGDELPDANAVFETLSRRRPGPGAPRGDGQPTAKGKHP
jgi:DNA-binding response OmpR family regulator